MREGLRVGTRLDTPACTVQSKAGLIQGEAILGPVPQGYVWYVEVFGYIVLPHTDSAAVLMAVTPEDSPLGGAGGIAAWDGAGLIATFPSSPFNFFSQPPAGIYVGPGHVLHFAAFNAGGLAAGDRVTVTAQTVVHQLDPEYLMSPEDRRQVVAAHERLGAELALDAVGERAN